LNVAPHVTYDTTLHVCNNIVTKVVLLATYRRQQ
jgi:hypothetical protein